MTAPVDFASWLVRGDALKCFPTRIAQARYANAWDYGDIELVMPQLERIFARVHRLTALNWLSLPGMAAAIDALEDGPGTFAEDWTESDFAVPVGDKVVSASWLVGDAQWDELEAVALREFLFLPVGEKIRTAREWRDRIAALRITRPAGLAALVSGAVRARMLARASAGSETLEMALGMNGLVRAAGELRARAEALLRARADIAASSPRFLTFAGLRACKHLFQVDQLLAQATSPSTENLMTYLRCTDLPAVLP